MAQALDADNVKRREQAFQLETRGDQTVLQLLFPLHVEKALTTEDPVEAFENLNIRKNFLASGPQPYLAFEVGYSPDGKREILGFNHITTSVHIRKFQDATEALTSKKIRPGSGNAEVVALFEFAKNLAGRDAEKFNSMEDAWTVISRGMNIAARKYMEQKNIPGIFKRGGFTRYGRDTQHFVALHQCLREKAGLKLMTDEECVSVEKALYFRRNARYMSNPDIDAIPSSSLRNRPAP